MSQFAVSTVQFIIEANTTVVPVVAQAGTALAPLIALAASSTIGLLMRPRDLLNLLKAKPWILGAVAAVAGVMWWLTSWLLAPPEIASGPATRPTSASYTSTTAAYVCGTDWAQVALAIIRQREASASLAAPTIPATRTAPPPPAGEPAPVTPAAAARPLFFRCDARRSGHLGGTAPTGLKPAWSYFAQDERNAMVLSSPIVRDGLVYSASCLLYPPKSFGTVSCVDLATGKERWCTTLKQLNPKQDFIGFFSSPAITADGSRLLIGQGLHLDYDSDLVCLDARTGEVMWTVATPLHIECSPCIEGDLVVVGAGSVEVGDEHKLVGDPQGRGNPGFVLGVRISTGEVLFRHPVNDPEGSPILENGICYIGSGVNGNRVVAFKADGSDADLLAAGQARRIWSVETPYPAAGAITLDGDTVLIGCGKGDFVFAAKDPEGIVMALDKRTGALRWKTTVPDAVLGPIAVVGTTAVVPCRNGEVLALDLAAQGALRWRTRINKQSPVLAGPAVTSTHVYAVSNDGYLVVLNAVDGKQIERVYLNAKGRPGELRLNTSSPLIIDGRVLVGSETGGLRCFVGQTP